MRRKRVPVTEETTGRRRLRVRGRESSLDVSHKEKLRRLVSEVSQRMLTMEILQNEIKDRMPKLEEAMKEAGVANFSCNKGDAIMQTPAGKSTTTIDPLGFYNEVDETDFFNSVKVPVTAAKKILSEKELEAISTTTPPAKKDPVLKVIPKKTR